MNYQLLLPQIFLFLWAILIFVLDFFWKREKQNLGYVALIGIVLTIVLVLTSPEGKLFGGMFLVDSLSSFFNMIFLLTGFLTIASSIDFTRRLSAHQGEYFALLLLSMVGMMFLASAGELITLYVALELTTISLYVLAAYLKNDRFAPLTTRLKSSEAGLKYLILGAVSSAILLYGISLIFGLTGTTFLKDIKTALIVNFLTYGEIGPALILSIILFIAGFGFKMALVPFHMWVPDVYEGAPTPITAFLSVASKAAGLVAFIRVFFQSFLVFQVDWVLLMAVLAGLAMIIGNIIALLQTNIKRMLAYSSIAQIGYILLGIVAATSRGLASVSFYLFVYLFANMGAFIAAITFSNTTGSDEIKDYAGLSRRSPALAAMMAVFMLSLVGIPPLAGFTGKYFLFSAAIEQGWIWLVVIAVLTSVISLYYYVGVVRQMYFQTSSVEKPITMSIPLKLALIISVIGVLIFGVYPNIFIDFATQAALVFHF
ncbi:MAG: NADH-quinone oxidoreductase subunit N [candidate division Zixibacteria bacterium]|nr:NADH-quinone oxidoreductase subunit N [candidate division Zixibacteria bacterium]